MSWPTADSLTPTADADWLTVDEEWSFDILASAAPSVDDALSSPKGADLLPQVLACAPRGEAWGTDEADDGHGAAPEQRKSWLGIATCLAAIYRWVFEVTVQIFPTAITFSLADWEEELGLPDPCGPSDASVEARKAAVSAKLTALGGSSPGYFTDVAAAAGFDISIEEPTGFECGASECAGPDSPTSTDPETVWIVRPDGYRMFEFEAGAGELGAGGARLVSYTDIVGLECLLRGIAPVHTQLVFASA